MAQATRTRLTVDISHLIDTGGKPALGLLIGPEQVSTSVCSV